MAGTVKPYLDKRSRDLVVRPGLTDRTIRCSRPCADISMSTAVRCHVTSAIVISVAFLKRSSTILE